MLGFRLSQIEPFHNHLWLHFQALTSHYYVPPSFLILARRNTRLARSTPAKMSGKCRRLLGNACARVREGLADDKCEKKLKTKLYELRFFKEYSDFEALFGGN